MPRAAAPPIAIKVAMPGQAAPAIHICRYPVPAPTPVFHAIGVPDAPIAANQRGALAGSTLLLPEGYVGRRWPLIPRTIDTTTSALWTHQPHSPLLLPLHVVQDVGIDAEWQMKVFTTPTSIGLPWSADVLADVGWAVLCRLPRNVAARWLAELAFFIDAQPTEPSTWPHIADLVAPPPALAGPLRAGVQGGNPIMHPRGVLWILRELLAVSDAERSERSAWLPDGLDERSVLGESWFSCLCDDEAPTFNQALLAVWLLHESYHGANFDGVDTDSFLSATTELAYRFPRADAWDARLERWLSIWSTSDHHPSVVDSPITPSELRRRFRDQVGLPIEQWLAGNWAMCFRWRASFGQPRPIGVDASELFQFPLEGDPVEFSDEFVHAFRSTAVRTVDQLADEVRREARSTYTGLGSLNQADSLACRNHPVLQFPDGTFYPLSIQLVADRACSLEWLQWGGRSTAAISIGQCFEAAVADELISLNAHDHRFVAEADLASVSDGQSRCDGLLMHGSEYLAIEISFQNLSRAIAEGDRAAIRKLAERYQAEADQAVSTVDKLTDVSHRLRLPTATSATFLVVAETTIALTPLFLQEMHALRPDRTPKFLCSADDLELLVELGRTGWSVPTAIRSWQSAPGLASLSTHLVQLATIKAPRPQSGNAVRRWIHNFPRS